MIKIAYLKTGKVDMLFFTIKHCQNLHSREVMAQGSRWENVWAWRCFFFFFFFFLRFDTQISSFLSLFPSLFFRFFLRISYLGHLSRAWLVLTRLHYEGTTVHREFANFFLLWKPFTPFLYMLVSWCSYYYYPACYRFKWYWNLKIAWINLAVRVVQKVLDSKYE